VPRRLVLAALSLATLGSLVIVFLEVSGRRGTALRRLLYDEDRPTASLNVATVAMRVDREPEANRRKMASIVRQIVRDRPDVELIVFGEALLGWFYSPPNTAQYQREVSETIPGATADTLASLAESQGIFISFGMTEAAGEDLFNSQVLLGPDGRILAVQRKKNLKGTVHTPGPTPVTSVDIKGIRVALVVCFDIQSPEARRLVLDRATDLIVLANADWTESWDRIGFSAGYMGRRFRSWIVSANRLGSEGPYEWDGHIEIIDPFGAVVASGRSEERVLYHEIRFDQNPPVMRRALRELYWSLSLPYFIARHPHTAFGYVTEGSPYKVWAWIGALGALLMLAVAIVLRRLAGTPDSRAPLA